MPDDRRESRILGLSIGVDHCMSKPVDLDELGMVLRNLQRRQRAKPTTPAATPEPANAANIDVADWQFDPNRWSLSFAQGPRVQLSMTEMLILQYLIGAAGQVASRDQLLRMLGHHGIRVYRSEEHTSELQSLMRNSY